jgi:hypothetical protein
MSDTDTQIDTITQNLILAEADNLLVDAGSNDPVKSQKATAVLAQSMTEELRKYPLFTAAAVDTPLRAAILDGDIISNIFVTEDFRNKQDFDYPIDLLTPGGEDDHVAYVLPDHGRIPSRMVDSNYIRLNTYSIGNSIGCTRKFLRNARWDVMRRMIEVMTMGFIKKLNDDGWQTLLAGADGRNIVVYDADAVAGQFTPKLVSLGKTIMRRNGGGNSSSVNRWRMTDLYMSPECMEDMTSWGLNLVSDEVRNQIFRSQDGSLIGFYGVNFHDLDELGVGQEYQLYYINQLSGALGPSSDEELLIGMDLSKRSKSFISPVVEELSIFEDNTLHRTGTVEFYGMLEKGFALMDTRGVLSLSA